jgi:hypothetical protein
MSSSGRASFEIQVQRDERWVIEHTSQTEDAARTAAKALLAKRSGSGVKIVKFWTRADGHVTETVILQELHGGPEAKVTMSPIEEAPYCKKVRDYYQLESRETIGRLFRKYIEKMILTPTEAIHSAKVLKRVQDMDTLFPPAVDRVATLQARAAGEDSRTRRDEVYKAVEQMTLRARKVEENPNLPNLRDGNLAGLVEKIATMVPETDAKFYALVALSRDLMQHDSWLAKFYRLTALTTPMLPDPVLALLDGVYADLFGVPAALQKVLGSQRNLAEALIAIADLWDGRMVPANKDLTETIEQLNTLLAQGRLDETRKSLMERLHRQLAGNNPLNRIDPTHEREAFRDVALRLFRPDGLLGGPATAAALTRRFVLMQEAGGKKGLENAVEGIVGLMTDSLFRVVYLSELSASVLGADLYSAIDKHIRETVMVPSIDALTPASWQSRDKMLRLTRLYERIGENEIWPSDLRQGLLDHIDRLLVGFIAAKGIIEKLDDPQAKLRDRAIRLLEFSAARVLPVGSEAHRNARDRIIALLRQPNFEMHIIEGITSPAEAEQILRQLHGLLARGGFRLEKTA